MLYKTFWHVVWITLHKTFWHCQGKPRQTRNAEPEGDATRDRQERKDAMLGRKTYSRETYSREELEHARAAVDGQLAEY
jgi:hypothetical protein